MRPAVAAFGPVTDTDTDTTTTPPQVHGLHLVLDGWDGDALTECYPCFLATRDAAEQLVASGFTGSPSAQPTGFPERSLVAFARRQDSDDVAERRGKFAGINDWLRQAVEDPITWSREESWSSLGRKSSVG